MPHAVVVDSGPLIAAFNRNDPAHSACSALFRRPELEFVIPALCVGETAAIIGARGGWRQEATFVRAVAGLDVRLPSAGDWALIASEIERYERFDIGVVDASVVVLAERLGADTIATLDHRHFRAIRPKHVEAFTLLP